MQIFLVGVTSWLLLVNCLLPSMSMSTSAPTKTIIIGGGIHGGSCAYYLKNLFNIESLILEKAGSLAPAASGKSGGFLAREWGSGPTVQLHQKSFDLHVDLARRLSVESFREVEVLSVQVGRKGKTGVSWLNRDASSTPMAGAAAQVTPLELTEKLIAASGAEVRLSTAVTGIITQETTKSGEVKVTGVSLSDGSIITAEKVIIAAGPWSGVMVEDWFGLSLPMQGVRSSSMVFKDCKPIEKEFAALFCTEDEFGCHAEFYPRPDGSLYVCGLGGSAYIQGDALRPGGSEYKPESIKPDATRITAGMKTFRKISSLGDSEPAISQACMRPLLPDGLPAMGIIPGVQGAYLSCGHNCWGILWAPISGYAMAELVASGRSEVVNLKPFRMDRFFTSETKRGRKEGKEDVGEQW